MKKISYKGFKPEARMLGMAKGKLQSAVDAANQWIVSNNVEVVNVETFWVYHANGKTTEDGVRVWFS